MACWILMTKGRYESLWVGVDSDFKPRSFLALSHHTPKILDDRLLTGGTTVHHHKKKAQMAMKMANGKLATNGKENMAVFGPHFDHVFNFNNHCPVDPTILTDIPQHPTLHDINSPITFDKVDAAINKLKNGKSPGLNGIPPKPTKQ
jgi:hypothetical protein